MGVGDGGGGLEEQEEKKPKFELEVAYLPLTKECLV